MTKPIDDLEAVRTLYETLQPFDKENQERIIRWTREKLGLAEISATQPQTHVPPSMPPIHQVASEHSPNKTPMSIKSFVDQKQPKSDIQFAATVAYYYRFEAPESSRKESIAGNDLQEACRLVGRQRIAQPKYTLINALNAGLLDRSGQGEYSINPVGENLVAMALPTDTTQGSSTRSRQRNKATKVNKSSKKKQAKTQRITKSKQR